MSINPEAVLSKRQLNLSTGKAISEATVSSYWIGPAVAIGDLVWLTLSCPVALALYTWLTENRASIRPSYIGLGCLVAVLTVALLESRGLYRRSSVLSKGSTGQILRTWIAVFSFLAISAFLLGIGQEFSRGTLLIYFFAGATGLVGGRHFCREMLGRVMLGGKLRGRRIYLIGTRDQVTRNDLSQSLKRHGYSIVASYFFDAARENADGVGHVNWDEVAEMIRVRDVDEVMLAVNWSNDACIQRIVSALSILPISVSLLPDAMVARHLERPLTDIGLTKAVELKREPLRLRERLQKRAFDIVVASIALVLLSPLLLLVALLIKLDSPGPVFFMQRRTGFNGRTFRIFKFRSMRTLDDGAEIRQATRDDDRITRVGRWLRASSIDELPQLLNVLFGDMSLVGPRPHAVAHNSQYDQAIANYALRHHVKPGITGWAQVCGFRGETPTVDLMLRRVEHDLWYIDNWSMWLDGVIVARTAIALMRPQNAY